MQLSERMKDELCALHLRNLLEDRRGDANAVRRVILAGGDALRFHDPSRPHLDRRDLDIALDVDRYDFAIRTVLEDGRPVARAEIMGDTGLLRGTTA
jgi:2-phosphosulfolactate phosphatase